MLDEGVVVVRAVPGSPAAQAGLRGIDQAGGLGDVILSANGQPARRLSDLTDQLEAVGVGREIELSVMSRLKTSAAPVEMSSEPEGLRKSAPETVKDELHGKPGQEYAGYSSDNVGPGLSQDPDEHVRRAHRDVGDDQTQPDHRDDGSVFAPAFGLALSTALPLKAPRGWRSAEKRAETPRCRPAFPRLAAPPR